MLKSCIMHGSYAVLDFKVPQRNLYFIFQTGVYFKWTI